MPPARVRSLLLFATLLSLSPGCALMTALSDGEEEQAPAADMGDGPADMVSLPDMPVDPPATSFDTLDECITSGCEKSSGTCVAHKGSPRSSCLGPSQLHERCTISQKIEPALPNASALATLMPDGAVVMFVQGSTDQKHVIRLTEENVSTASASLSSFVAHEIAPGMQGQLNVLATQGAGLSLSIFNLNNANSLGSVPLTFSMPDSPAIKLCGAPQPLFTRSYVVSGEQRLAAVFCDETMGSPRWQLGGFKPELNGQMLGRLSTSYGTVVPGPAAQAFFALNAAQNPNLAYLVNNAGAGRYKLDPYSFDPAQSGMPPESVAGVTSGKWAAYDLPPSGPLSSPCANVNFGAQPPRLWLPSGALADRLHIVAAGDKNYQILAPGFRNGPLVDQYCEDDNARYTLRDAKYEARMDRATSLFERLPASATQPEIYVDMFGSATSHDKRVVLGPTASDSELRAVAALPLDNRVIVTGMRSHNGEQQVFAMSLSPQARPICRTE